MRYTPENITRLEPNEVFVFGSNLNGQHLGGGARQALEFGAVMGRGQGLWGSSYAFPTLDRQMQQIPLRNLAEYRDNFYLKAIQHPELTFLLTKVGCGIAGYQEQEMKELFKVKLSNVIYPEGW
jgi:hypothetical protein